MARSLCSVSGCNKAIVGRGLCDTHYRRWRRHGVTDRLTVTPSECSVEGCSGKHFAKGYCSKHWQRSRKYGNAVEPLKRLESVAERLDAYTDRSGPPFEDRGPCWMWTGHLRHGYGSIVVAGKTRFAHRVSYEHHVGPIEDGYELDHLCRNKACCNPAHVEPVTHHANVLRGALFKHGRRSKPLTF